MARSRRIRRTPGALPRPVLALAVPSAVIAMACAAVPAPVHAQSAEASSSATAQDVRHYQIAAGALDDALADFAAAAGLSVTVPPELVAGKSSPGLNGNLSITQGFARLLSGSGLYAEAQPGGAYVVQRLPQSQSGEGVVTLPAVSVTARGLATEGSGSYAAPGASIMKTATSLREIPQSVTVVTRQRMDDFNLNTLDDVLLQTPGLSLETLGAGNKLFVSRGFEIRNMQVDGVSKGFWGGTSAMGIQPDMAMYDRVEVLRGAAGLLLGNGTPGGTVNFVRKRPLHETAVSMEVNAGSWDYYRAMLDATGALNTAGSLRGRTVMSVEDRGYNTRKTHSNQPFFYGVLEYDLTPSTVLTAGARYQEYKKDGAYWYGGLPSSTDGSDLRLKRSTSFGPSWAYYKAQTSEFFAEAKHDFNDRWSMKVTANYQRTHRSDATLWLRGTADPTTLQGAYMVPSETPGETMETKTADVNVTGKLNFWGREHVLNVGANRLEETGVGSSEYQYQTRIPVSLSNPYQVGVPRPEFNNAIRTDDKTVSEGIYGSLRLRVTDPMQVVLGGRLSWYNYRDATNPQSAYKQTREFTPYAGLLYDVTPEWTAYASYADIFEPQSNSKTVSGSPLKPAIGSNYELGIKGELLDGRLNTSLAVFYIRQNDRAMIDPDNASGCPASPTGGACYINAGKVESKGVEAELSGELMPGLQAWAGYTFNQQVYLKDRDSRGQPSSNEGAAFSSITPKHIFRAGASYRLPGAFSKFTVGGGVSAQSKTGYASGSVWRQQSGYAIWNAFARYQIDKHWSMSMNVDNLFDRTYYTSPGQNVYGEPANVMLTLRGQF